MKMNKRNDVDSNNGKVKLKSNDNDVEVFGDDDEKESEKQQETVVLPLEGGLAGLITNLSGVKYNLKKN